MKLVEYRDEDKWLTEALECDPDVMRELGGPTPRENIPKVHARRLKSVLAKEVWYFTINPDDSVGPVGTVGIWESDWQGARVHEMGWMILPAFSGRGLVTAAGKAILDLVRNDERVKEIHAFPSIGNGASNAICRKLGFSLVGAVQVSYNGPPQPSNDWVLQMAITRT